MAPFTRKASTCTHVTEEHASPTGDACEACGSTFNLRVCQDCGTVACCESQAGHNREHFRTTGHPVIRSLPVGRGFTWCYECRTYV